MQRRKVLSIGASSATMLVEDVDGMAKVLKRINVHDWSRDECHAAADMYAILSHRRGIAEKGSDGAAEVPGSSGLVDVFSVTMQSSFLNILCEYIPDGALLDSMRHRNSQFDNITALRWGYETALALVEVHQLGYLHRNLNTRAMFLDRDGSIRLGIPRCHRAYMNRARSGTSAFEPRLVTEGSTVDESANSFPPEVTRSGIFLGSQSDVWHWGATMREVLGFGTSGSDAWKAGRDATFASLVAAALLDDPDRRPTTTSICTALARLLGQPPPQLEFLRSPRSSRTRNSRDDAVEGQRSRASPSPSYNDPAVEAAPRRSSSSSPPLRSSERRGASPTRSSTTNPSTEWSARASMQFDALQELQRQVVAQHTEGRRSGAANVRGSTALASSTRRPREGSPGRPENMMGSATTADPAEGDADDDGLVHDIAGANRFQRHNTYTHGRSSATAGRMTAVREPTSPTVSGTASGGTQRKAGAGSLQHTLRTMPKHQRMELLREVGEQQQQQKDERRREQEARRRAKETERREAESRHRDHVEKMRRIRSSKSNIKETRRPAAHAPPTDDVGVLKGAVGVEIFVKNPATLELSATDVSRAATSVDLRGTHHEQRSRQQHRDPATDMQSNAGADNYSPERGTVVTRGADARGPSPRYGHDDDDVSPLHVPPPQPTAPGGAVSSSTQVYRRHGYSADEYEVGGNENVEQGKANRGLYTELSSGPLGSSPAWDTPPRAPAALSSFDSGDVQHSAEPQRAGMAARVHAVKGAVPPSAVDIGMVAIVECSIDALRSSLSRELDPVQMEEVSIVIEAFAMLSADNRALPYRNKQLTEKLRSAVGDEAAFQLVLPLLLQLVSLESAVRSWNDLAI